MPASTAIPRGTTTTAALALAAVLTGAAAPARGEGIERVSVGPGGVQADAQSFNPRFSAGGRYVAFDSPATNLVPGDSNDAWDVFVRDRETNRTERVSVGPGGKQGDGSSERPAISADGRFVAFESWAPNLVPGDTNRQPDVFVRDRTTGKTERASVGRGGDGGGYGGALSADGRYVAFESGATGLVPGDTNGAQDVFVHNRRTGTTRRPSVGPGGVQGDGDSRDPVLSADGRHVAFQSDATNLVPGDTNGHTDIFVRTR